MNFKTLSPIAWEVERGDCDCRIRQRRLVGLGFHIRLEQDDYVIDVFDSTVESPDEAYLTSHRGKGMKAEG